MAMPQSKDGGRLSRGDPAPKAGSLKNKIKPCSRAAQAREGGSKQHGGKGHITGNVQEPQVLTLHETFFALT